MRSGLPEGLGAAAHAYLDAFPCGDVVAFPIHPLDRLGLPVWVVALFPKDPALAGIMPYGVGYGATDQFGLPNLYCVGIDERAAPAAPIMDTACGEACHADRAAALDKCLTEYAASRARKAFAHGPADLVASVAPADYVARFMAQAGGAAKSSDRRAFAAMQDWTQRSAEELRDWLSHSMLAERASHAFSALPTQPAPDGHARAPTARAAIEAAGFDILYVDMSPPDRAVTVVKVIVPGMEVETMSYYRIGARNTEKLLELGSPLVQFGEEGAALRRIRLPEADAERLGHPLFDTAMADRLVGPLYPLYREPEAHHVAFEAGAE